MSRRTLIPTSLVAAAITFVVAAPAEAVDLRGGAFDMVLQKPNAAGDGFIDMSTQDIDEFFNLSNCLCSVQFAVEITLRGASGTLQSKPVEVWVGQNCDDSNTTERDKRCAKIATYDDVNVLKTPTTVPIYVSDLASPVALPCTEEQEVTRNVFLLIDDEGDFQYENVISLADELFVDTLLPPLPEPAEVVAGEAGALVSWTIPEANADDIRSFQLLCARADGSWSDDDGFGEQDPAYLTPLLVCPEAFQAASPAAPAGGTDAGIADAGAPDAGRPGDGGAPGAPDAGAPPTGIDALDPMFTCSGEIGGTTSEYRLSGLTNGVEYRIFLVTIDPRLNPSWIDLGTITPKAVTDFWEDYKDSGGVADGEYCFVATATYGNYDHPFVRVLRDFRDDVLASSHFGRRLIRAYYDNSPALANVIAGNPLLRAAAWLLLLPIVLLAGAWVYTGVLGKLALVLAFALWRVHRRRRASLGRAPAPIASRRARGLAAATTAIALLAWSQLAEAQPYWDEPAGPADQVADAIRAPAASKWQLEIKLGPYVPDIDSEFQLAEGEQGPYERMFGNDKQVMTRFELDRFFLYPSGQLGAGIGIGYLSTQAHAFQVDDNGQILVDARGRPVRATGDETTLRFMPLDLHAVYRFTALDDDVGIPLIPYGKLGLTWYLWQITRPDGATAAVNDDPACTMDCATNEGRGGTLGWQATVGLAIRAERIDAKAAQALQSDMGIEHSGFFAELSYAKVDGLFSDDKLRLGDFTWYAGVNFEF